MTKICLNCTLPSRHAGVIAGKYYPRLCDKHFNQLIQGQMPSSGSASHDRQRDLEDHLQDIQQPRVGGKVNPNWTKLWPKRAHEMFTDEQIEDAERRG